MHPNVKQKARAYLRAFKDRSAAEQQADTSNAAARLALYQTNAHGMTPLYQQAGIVYLRLLRKMENKKQTKVAHTERAHALLSASGASRWINCTPSPRLEEGFPEESSSFAQEGTLAHEFAELILRQFLGRIEPKDYKEQFERLSKSKHYGGQEMIEYVNQHVDYVLEQFREAQRNDKHAVLLIEERVDLTHLIEEGFGSCDVIIIANGTLETIDLKYGAGVRVSARDNPQLKLYGLGALEKYELKYDIDKIKLTITQPRMDSISSWEDDANELIKWGAEVVKPAAAIAYQGEGDLQAGEWCKFCKAAPRCTALNDLTTEATVHLFDDPKLLTDDELVGVYGKIKAVNDWFSKVSAYMYSEAVAGKKWEGFKLVDGVSRRAWTDEDEVAKILYTKNLQDVQIYNTKLKGIGDIEKLVGKKVFPELLGSVVVSKATSPTLVELSDKRPEMVKADYFEDLDGEI